MGISVRANTQAAAATNGHEAPEGVDLARVPVWDDPAHGHVVGVKRALDIVLSLLLLVFLAPLLLIIAAMIKADSPGPVLFRQTRVGRWGKPFSMLKFRTMFQGADEKKPELLHLNESEGLFKITGDPRITRFGRLLRGTSLDELPQFFNVLQGRMSVVGPRPHSHQNSPVDANTGSTSGTSAYRMAVKRPAPEVRTASKGARLTFSK